MTEEREESRFLRLADAVSYGMGTPKNIGFWVFVVIVWFALGPWIAATNFLPAWFTSQAFNFPLNTVTTLAELYIGFLVAAASNRSERHLKQVLAAIQGKQQDTLQEIEADEREELAILARLDEQDRKLLTILEKLESK